MKGFMCEGCSSFHRGVPTGEFRTRVYESRNDEEAHFCEVCTETLLVQFGMREPADDPFASDAEQVPA